MIQLRDHLDYNVMVLGILLRYINKRYTPSQQKKIETILKSPKSFLIILLINTFKRIIVYILINYECLLFQIGGCENPNLDKIHT